MCLAIVAGFGSLSPAEGRERRRPLAEMVEQFLEPDSRSYRDYEQESEAEQGGYDQLAQQDQDIGIRPSEAAAIARDVVPGARVVGVKLLSNGYYAVTLRTKGSVTRVLVNAQDGSVR
jgi:hypothetical protein